MPIAAESEKILNNVKQSGKPAKFVLLTKGSKVLNVVAYRVGGQDGKIKEAKEAGMGDVACGVVDGKGAQLSFKLLRSDGFEAAPVTHTKLKDFLNEGTDLGLKPSIDIVDALPAVEDGTAYRTAEQWKALIASTSGKSDQERTTILAQLAREFNLENQRVTTDLQTNPNSPTALGQQEILRKVSGILKSLSSGPPTRQPPPTPGQQQPTPPTTQPPTTQPPPTPPRQQQPTPPTTQPPTTPPPTPPRQQQTTPPTTPQQQPMPQVPQTPPARRRQQQLSDPNVKLTQQMASEAAKKAKAGMEDPFEGADLNQLSNDAQQAADKTRIGVHKDKALPEIHRLMKEADALAKNGQLAEAHLKLVEAQRFFETGKAEQEKERKKAILDATKKIHDDRLAEYAKIEPILNATTAKIGTLSSELRNTGTALCKEVKKMTDVGTVDAINPHIVANLEQFIEMPGAPAEIAALGKQLAKKARDLLEAEFNRRGSGATSRQAKAELLLELAPSKGAGGTSGTSEVNIVRNFNKEIEFAFKPLDGESEQNEGDTLREVLTSAMTKKFQELTNLDLGFPDVSVANIEGRQGALIEGLKGFEIPAEKAPNLTDEEKAQLEQMAKDLPPKELQKAMLSAMVSGDFDMKWDNVFIGEDGKSARRFDGGKGFPDKKGRAEVFMFGTSGKMPNPEGCLLLFSPFDRQPLQAGTAPMSQDLVQDFLKIKGKMDELKKDLKAKAKTACNTLSTSEKPQQIDEKVIDQTCRSIETACSILEGNNQITTAQFFKAFAAQRVLDMAGDYLADLKTEIDGYDQNGADAHAKQMKFEIDPDIQKPVQAIRDVIQRGAQNYDDARDGKVLNSSFCKIDHLLALKEYASIQPTSIDLNAWKKAAGKIFVDDARSLDVNACTNLIWSALAQLTQKEQLTLVERCAFNGSKKIENVTGATPRAGFYPAIRFERSTTDNAVVVLGSKIMVRVVYKLKQPATMPTANDVVTLIRAAL